MRFDLTKVRFSKADKIKNIRIPTELIPELAEDIGIHIGDGTLYKCNPRRTSFAISYSLSSDEKDYLEYIISLKRRLYNLSRIREYRYGNELRITFNSLAIATFYQNILELLVGRKSQIVNVPKIIKNANINIVASFIRGIADTDFSFIIKHKYGKIYPVLEGTFASKGLVLSLSQLFKKIGIKHVIKLNEKRLHKKTNKIYISNRITINGYERIKSFFYRIGSNNNTKLERYKQIRKSGPDEIRTHDHLLS